MTQERRVKLCMNGRSQPVRIPRELKLPGADAMVRKEGDRLIIEPAPPKSLLAVLGALMPLDEELSKVCELPIDPVNL